MRKNQTQRFSAVWTSLLYKSKINKVYIDWSPLVTFHRSGFAGRGGGVCIDYSYLFSINHTINRIKAIFKDADPKLRRQVLILMGGVYKHAVIVG